jgi:hypothetical protein
MVGGSPTPKDSFPGATALRSGVTKSLSMGIKGFFLLWVAGDWIGCAISRIASCIPRAWKKSVVAPAWTCIGLHQCQWSAADLLLPSILHIPGTSLHVECFSRLEFHVVMANEAGLLLIVTSCTWQSRSTRRWTDLWHGRLALPSNFSLNCQDKFNFYFLALSSRTHDSWSQTILLNVR